MPNSNVIFDFLKDQDIITTLPNVGFWPRYVNERCASITWHTPPAIHNGQELKYGVQYYIVLYDDKAEFRVCECVSGTFEYYDPAFPSNLLEVIKNAAIGKL